MEYSVKQNKLKPYSRGVSIIGVGATPFMITMDNPETNGLGEGELFGYAAIEAMKDAGVTAADVDFFVHAQAGPGWQSNFGTPGMHVANWFGMKGKANVHHSEACCTGYIGLEQAVSLVASGTYDVVLSGCCDFSASPADPFGPSYARKHTTDEIFHGVLLSINPRDYSFQTHACSEMQAEAWLDQYAEKYNVSPEEMDEALINMAKNSRRASAMNPLGMMRQTYDEQAQQMGMKDADEFLRSKFNPKLLNYLRACNMELGCDGAAAVVVCASDIAHKYCDHPIEVLGIGHSCLEASTARLEKYATEAAYKQVKELTGLTGKDMDLFLTNDFIMTSQFLSAEVCEYIPEGEGWKYARDGRIAFDGDRPINTNGGRCQYGHAHGTSGMADLYEAVKQMRGEMGPTQVKKPVKYAMLRGYGGGQNLTCAILKNTK